MFTEIDRQTAIRSCRYCPMCHHADLTATLERRETYSARGRGLLLFAIEQAKTDWNDQMADVMYRYFVDGLCKHVCAGNIPHDDMVIDARRQLVTAGQAPESVAQIKADIEKTGNPWGEKEPDLSALTNTEPQGDILVYFGPAARIQRPASVKALVKVMKKASMDFTFLADEGDPGLLLHELGEFEAGAVAAQALTGKITKSGAQTVVTPDADAYRVFKNGLGQVPPLSESDVRHASEFIAELTAKLKFRKPAELKTAYHDPCTMARFALCLDAPRALVQTICGTEPLEIGVWSRELANCSGECGGVPFTRPALSQKAAKRRIHEACEAGAELIVTGSPASAAVLEGNGLDVLELSEFVAEALI